jgi:transmembrane serine protease 9
MLQRLTCVTDPESEPIVCCPLKDIINPKVSEELLIDHSATSSMTQRSTSTTTTTETPVRHPDVDLRNHPNFKLIPDLKSCSLSVVQDRIIGGKNVSHGTYPWMARIGYKNKNTGVIAYYCGGTIINKRYIITASHCTKGFDDNFMLSEVRLGEHDTNVYEDCNPDLGNVCSTPQDYRIEKVISHERYNSFSKQNDISLIKVNRDISFDSYFIRPVCLPFLKEYGIPSSVESKLGQGYVAGWGRTQWSKAEGSVQLLEVKLPIISNSDCQEIYKRRVVISENQLCAGGEMSKDSCGGDSGGPLMENVDIPNSISKMFQFGVVSFGPVQCGVGGLPGVYNRVSQYLKWILDNIEP